jgi:transposase
MAGPTQHATTAAGAEVAREPASTPFAQNIIQLTQAAYIQLKWNGNYWKRQHEHLKRQNKELEQSLALAQAKIKDLNRRLYGKKSEKGSTKRDTPAIDDHPAGSRPRGQQKGSQGHGRTLRPDLPVVEEVRDVNADAVACGLCGEAFVPLTKTEDSEIIEIAVNAHVRRIKRKRYRRVCQCAGSPGLITAPPAPRLIPRSPIGVSVWTEVLLNKYLIPEPPPIGARMWRIVVCPLPRARSRGD